jgi:hypothetical protein
MPYIDPKVIEEAKRMDLLTYLQNFEPHELVRFSSGVYRTKTHSNLKISNGKWCLWNDNGQPGDGGRSALDYLIKIQGMKFTEAVEQIVGYAAVMPVIPIPQQTTSPKELTLPKKNTSHVRMMKYLQGRGIDRDILIDCFNAGLIYESAPYHNVVFVGKDLKGKERYASLRGIGTEFKGEAGGSDKRFAFGLSPNGVSDTVHFLEGGIDALSYATLQKLNGITPIKDYLWTLGGVYTSKRHIEEKKLPDSIEQFFKDHPNVKLAVLHLDNDIAGRSATKMIMDILSSRGIVVCDKHMPSGKDCNDYLCDRLGIPRNKSTERSHVR